MPLVRLEVRNELALGATELYREANKEDPKEILEGVAVAGLVGVLRQLGDLAEFAAEVFHGLQEDVMRTSSRSRKLMSRVQRIEAALSPLEKAVLAQRSHLHFAYTAGSNWHTHIQCEQNHFIYGDVPQFIMDSYEDCRGPPRLHLLDRFDPAGPGSCLKRYSDPTYFKRASVASGEATAENVLKDRKARQHKKRRSWPRSGEVPHEVSFSHHSGRMQFSHLNGNGNCTPSQRLYTYGTTHGSGSDEQSQLNRKNESVYNEWEFRPSYSTQPEEQESREYNSSVERPDSDFLDYNFVEEKPCGHVQVNLSQEQAGHSSSSIAWDGKAETPEPRMHDYDGMSGDDDHNRNLESLSLTMDPQTPGNNAFNLETLDELDSQPCGQAFPSTGSGDFHIDDIESEPDHFVDALNTIESESETDMDFRNLESKNCSKLEDGAVEEGSHELIGTNLVSQSSVSDYNVLANGSFGQNLIVSPESSAAVHSSISGAAMENEPNLVSQLDEVLLSQSHEVSPNPGSPQRCGPNINHSPQNNNVDNDRNVESVSSSVYFRDDEPMKPIIEETRSSIESQKPAPEASNVTSVTFWTNGGLLGLQPSKPPDCSVSNAFPQDHVSNKDGPAEDSTSSREEEENDAPFRKPYWKISPADLDVKLRRSGDSLCPNNCVSTKASVTGSGSSLPVNSELLTARNCHEHSRSSSRMFELGNRLFSAGSNKKLLPVEDKDSIPSSCQNTNVFEQKNHLHVPHRTFSGRTKDLLGGEPLILSASSSPPLEHMKISFQPIDGFEISKLKLKFSDGNYNESREIFPSFQLVPEVTIAQHNVDSDTDDDTFYRSSPSLSEDCHTHQSESNSEQWESGGSPSSKDRDLYDALRRISLTESVSTIPENGNTGVGNLHGNYEVQFPSVENSMQNSHSGRSFDLRSLDSPNHSFRELKNNNNLKDIIVPQFDSTPAEWRGTRPSPDDTKDKHQSMLEVYSYGFDVKNSSSTISQQPKPAPINQDQMFELKNVLNSKQFPSHKSNGRAEATQGQRIDERDSFLQQIRMKSFSLRPTVIPKPTSAIGGSASMQSNIQVSAILEKANAIRQAVGSDDGENDSNWSDT